MSAESITNGFEKVFGKNYTRVYDWAHINRNVRDELKYIGNKEQRTEIMIDIEQLQISKIKEIFAYDCTLFFKNVCLMVMMVSIDS